MIERYQDKRQAEIWSVQEQLRKWQQSELAVIEARGNLGRLGKKEALDCHSILTAAPFDVERWAQLEKELHHDLQAFVEERREKLPAHLQGLFHFEMTSYDTEEPAFVRRLSMAVERVYALAAELEKCLIDLARKYRYTPMNLRTHGQEAELGSFGKRCLSWLVELRIGGKRLKEAQKLLGLSKMSGAVGNYGGLDPELERMALRLLGLGPFYGATQIIPRILYIPTAEALCIIMQTVNKIAHDIRLMARSGLPLVQEPFGKKQQGSSAMPHKKNTINLEKIEGMLNLALGYKLAIEKAIQTWEERDIGQSSVERVAWPDLFHTVCHALETLGKVLSGLQVYPDNMLREIINSCGCYASSAVKSFLMTVGVEVGLSANEAYRIVQLAAFNVFEPPGRNRELRRCLPGSGMNADGWLAHFQEAPYVTPVSIREHIATGSLRTSVELSASEEGVARWNVALLKLFSTPKHCERWHQLFLPSTIMRDEEVLYKEILGDD